MPADVVDLVNRLEPIIGQWQSDKYRRMYRIGKLNSPELRKITEDKIRN